MTTPCFEWRGATDGREPPYGKITLNGVKRRTHRASYRIHYGSLDDSLVICHACDNTLCWNPLHLFEDTQSANMLDMHSKNRHTINKRRKGLRL